MNSPEQTKFEGDINHRTPYGNTGHKPGYLIIDKDGVNIWMKSAISPVPVLKCIAKYECINPKFQKPKGSMVAFEFIEGRPFPPVINDKIREAAQIVSFKADTSTVETFCIVLRAHLDEKNRQNQSLGKSVTRPPNRLHLNNGLNINKYNPTKTLQPAAKIEPRNSSFKPEADGFNRDSIKKDCNSMKDPTTIKRKTDEHNDSFPVGCMYNNTCVTPKKAKSDYPEKKPIKRTLPGEVDLYQPLHDVTTSTSGVKRDTSCFSTMSMKHSKTEAQSGEMTLLGEDLIKIEVGDDDLNSSMPTGLTNIGNTCYMNAVISTLKSLRSFRSICEKAANQIRQKAEDLGVKVDEILPYYSKFMSLHKKLEHSALKRTLEELRVSIMKDEKNEERIGKREQEDAHEFLVKFIDKIEIEMKTAMEVVGLTVTNPIYDAFTYKVTRNLVCTECKDSRLSDEDGTHFLLHMVRQLEDSTDQSIATLFRNELLSEMVEATCPKCGHASALMTQEFAKLPTYLIFVVKRLVYDPETTSMTKIADPLCLDKYIAIKKLEPSTSNVKRTSTSIKRTSTENMSMKRRESIITKNGKQKFVNLVATEKDPNERVYNPVDNELRKKICKMLEIDYESEKVDTRFNIYNTGIESTDLKFKIDDPPYVLAEVDADGNCLFRALSFLVTGGDDTKHAVLRKKICDLMERHLQIFAKLHGASPEEFKEHIRKMRMDGEWGTATEIIGFASMFSVHIFTYTKRWISYRPLHNFEVEPPETRKIDDLNPNMKALYLYNPLEIHFSPVICVLPKSLYKLMAVINHKGGTSSGHYTSNVKRHNKWVHCDDALVREWDFDDVKDDSSQSGYIVVYEKTREGEVTDRNSRVTD